MAVPSTANPERAREVLVLANHVRTTNAGAFRELKSLGRVAGLRRAAEILTEGDMKGPTGSMQVFRLLKSVKGTQDVKAQRLMYKARIFYASTSLRQLTARQRNILAAELKAQATAR